MVCQACSAGKTKFVRGAIARPTRFALLLLPGGSGLGHLGLPYLPAQVQNQGAGFAGFEVGHGGKSLPGANSILFGATKANRGCLFVGLGGYLSSRLQHLETVVNVKVANRRSHTRHTLT
jgi:hypothetical protein